jgi:hypothetical protein
MLRVMTLRPPSQVSSAPRSVADLLRRAAALCLTAMLVCAFFQPTPACTIGVAAGRATADGRPLLWKNRDQPAEPHNEVHYSTSLMYRHISIITAGQPWKSWMGVNEKGFAIGNSTSYDLPAGPDGLTNGELMRVALQTCATVAEFQSLLDSTNVKGRQTQANFAVIDTTGAAAMFETGGRAYWKYDANDSSVAPDGYVIRTNFAFAGGGYSGRRQYVRSTNLVAELYHDGNLSHVELLREHSRDFSDYDSDPLPVPYPDKMFASTPFGYICTAVSICRWSTVSAGVVHGVLPAEPAELNTMWVMLGQPATAIAVPYWPVGGVPPEANGPVTAPLCDASLRIKYSAFTHFYVPEMYAVLDFVDSYALRDEYGMGVWALTFAAEDSILAATDSLLALWRQQQHLPVQDMLEAEQRLASCALSQLVGIDHRFGEPMPAGLASAPPDPALCWSFPNPFNNATTICYSVPATADVELAILNAAGQRVRQLVYATMPRGLYSALWDGTILGGKPGPSGVYFYRVRVGDVIHTGKLTLGR